MAAHESPRTTKLYDRTKERLTQDEVEGIRLLSTENGTQLQDVQKAAGPPQALRIWRVASASRPAPIIAADA
jgi:hypothetical protein